MNAIEVLVILLFICVLIITAFVITLKMQFKRLKELYGYSRPGMIVSDELARNTNHDTASEITRRKLANAIMSVIDLDASMCNGCGHAQYSQCHAKRKYCTTRNSILESLNRLIECVDDEKDSDE